MPMGNADDDDSYNWMFIIGRASKGDDTSYWLADNAGLGVQDTMITSSGDRLVWGV